eukprot:3555847-Alexandrium_andersonii.AAC.1
MPPALALRWVLKQSAEFMPAMLKKDHVFPALLRSGTPKIWSEKRHRWMTAREKASLMGFPVTPELAAALK